MTLYKSENGNYSISSGGTWLPGIYADERTAKYAFRFPNNELQKLQDSVNPDGAITFKMLQESRKRILHDNT